MTGDGSKQPPDFSTEKPEIFFQPEVTLDVDKEKWKARVRDCSKRASRGVATRAVCQVDFEANTIYFVNSEGSEQQLSWTNAHFTVSVGVKADDGMTTRRRWGPGEATRRFSVISIG